MLGRPEVSPTRPGVSEVVDRGQARLRLPIINILLLSFPFHFKRFLRSFLRVALPLTDPHGFSASENVLDPLSFLKGICTDGSVHA